MPQFSDPIRIARWLTDTGTLSRKVGHQRTASFAPACLVRWVARSAPAHILRALDNNRRRSRAFAVACQMICMPFSSRRQEWPSRTLRFASIQVTAGSRLADRARSRQRRSCGAHPPLVAARKRHVGLELLGAPRLDRFGLHAPGDAAVRRRRAWSAGAVPAEQRRDDDRTDRERERASESGRSRAHSTVPTGTAPPETNRVTSNRATTAEEEDHPNGSFSSAPSPATAPMSRHPGRPTAGGRGSSSARPTAASASSAPAWQDLPAAPRARPRPRPRAAARGSGS